MRTLILIALALSGCTTYPQLVMLNPQTGATVGCQQPDPGGSPTDYLVSHACISACEARGFRPVPGMQGGVGEQGIPDQCAK